MATKSPVFILADEGIKEYSSEDERLSNCKRWYGLVIEEAKRRGFQNLAKIESKFRGTNNFAPRTMEEISKKVRLTSPRMLPQLDWFPHTSIGTAPRHEFGGGLFTATFLK